MLVTEGLEPSTDAETFIEFDSRIAQKSVVPVRLSRPEQEGRRSGSKEASAESAREKMAFAKGFVDACRTATDQMGKDLKLSAVKEKPPVAPAPVEIKPAAPVPTARQSMICVVWPVR